MIANLLSINKIRGVACLPCHAGYTPHYIDYQHLRRHAFLKDMQITDRLIRPRMR